MTPHEAELGRGGYEVICLRCSATTKAVRGAEMPSACPKCAQVFTALGPGVSFGYKTDGDNWSNLATLACVTCRFFVPKTELEANLQEVNRGRCRRHAPSMDGYPVVYPTDWCGDHKLGTNPSRQVANG